MELERVGRGYYDPGYACTWCAFPPLNVEIWPGFEFSIKKHSHGILLALNVKYKMVRTDSALSILNYIKAMNHRSIHSEIKNRLIGHVVETRYNNKTYKIDDVLLGIQPKDVVQLQSGRISYADYYKRNHEIVIKDLNQPMLLSVVKTKDSGTGERTEKQVHLIPEVCYMTGLTDELRSNLKFMPDLAQDTKVDAEKERLVFERFRQDLDCEAKTLLQSWGLQIETSM